MKRTSTKQAKVNNWLTHRETRDEIWDLMASKWSVRAESIAKYGRSHMPAPVKTVLRATIKQPLQSVKQYRMQKKDRAEVVGKPLQLSSAGK